MGKFRISRKDNLKLPLLSEDISLTSKISHLFSKTPPLITVDQIHLDYEDPQVSVPDVHIKIQRVFEGKDKGKLYSAKFQVQPKDLPSFSVYTSDFIPLDIELGGTIEQFIRDPTLDEFYNHLFMNAPYIDRVVLSRLACVAYTYGKNSSKCSSDGIESALSEVHLGYDSFFKRKILDELYFPYVFQVINHIAYFDFVHEQTNSVLKNATSLLKGYKSAVEISDHLKKLQEILTIDPKNGEAHYLVACLSKKDDPLNGVEEIKKHLSEARILGYQFDRSEFDYLYIKNPASRKVALLPPSFDLPDYLSESFPRVLEESNWAELIPPHSEETYSSLADIELLLGYPKHSLD